jgi:hypothetical protein
MWDQRWDQMWDQMWDHMWDQLWDHMWDQMWDQVAELTCMFPTCPNDALHVYAPPTHARIAATHVRTDAPHVRTPLRMSARRPACAHVARMCGYVAAWLSG